MSVDERNAVIKRLKLGKVGNFKRTKSYPFDDFYLLGESFNPRKFPILTSQMIRAHFI